VFSAGSYDPAGITDSVVLDRKQRQARGVVLSATGGISIELDLRSPAVLQMGDALVLDDGRLVEVLAEAEPLFEVRVPDLGALARLAWRLGDRHIPVQILPKRLRVSRDPIAEAVLRRFGVVPVAIEAPFEPEGGAYRVASAHSQGPADHGHAHHDHSHHDHHHHDHHAHAAGGSKSDQKR